MPFAPSSSRRSRSCTSSTLRSALYLTPQWMMCILSNLVMLISISLFSIVPHLWLPHVDLLVAVPGRQTALLHRRPVHSVTLRGVGMHVRWPDVCLGSLSGQ